ncbi:MAG: hypothetical protein FWD73_06600 [Polyangiaceae bacterium]|nr:hypothetical protein [Polyangiaceae bacterium]
MSPTIHKRYLDYRAKHIYFGRDRMALTMDQFESADREQRELEAKGDAGRDDEEETRFAELNRILFRD